LAERQPDRELEASTNRWIMVGIVLTVLAFLAFPLYRLYEPATRAEAREVLVESMVAQGEEIFAANCASCHGVAGQGVDAPALNSQQFLASANNESIASIIAHGIPGTEMSAYGLDFGGFLTSQQINSITLFIRSWEEDAPDRPDWRDPQGECGAVGHDEEADDGQEEEADDDHDEAAPEDCDEEAEDGHDE